MNEIKITGCHDCPFLHLHCAFEYLYCILNHSIKVEEKTHGSPFTEKKSWFPRECPLRDPDFKLTRIF